jgi:hypothetical protein
VGEHLEPGGRWSGVERRDWVFERIRGERRGEERTTLSLKMMDKGRIFSVFELKDVGAG